MKQSSILFLAATLLSNPALSSSGVGNGGFVVICPNNRIELLDYMEAAAEWDFELELGPNHFSIDEKVSIALSRLSRFDEERAERYRAHLADFESEAQRTSGMQIAPTKDANLRFIPPADCQVVNLVSQAIPRNPDEKRYRINQDLWKKVEEIPNYKDVLAGMKLHEIILRDAVSLGATDSDGARYMTAVLSSSKFKTLTREEFQIRFRAAGLLEEYLDLNRKVRYAHKFFRETAPLYRAAAPELRSTLERSESKRASVLEDEWLVRAHQSLESAFSKAKQALENTDPRQSLGASPAAFFQRQGSAFVRNLPKLQELLKKYSLDDASFRLEDQNQLDYYYTALLAFAPLVAEQGKPIQGPAGTLLKKYSVFMDLEGEVFAGILDSEHTIFVEDERIALDAGSQVKFTQGQIAEFQSKQGFPVTVDGHSLYLGGTIRVRAVNGEHRIESAVLLKPATVVQADKSVALVSGTRIEIRSGKIVFQ